MNKLFSTLYLLMGEFKIQYSNSIFANEVNFSNWLIPFTVLVLLVLIFVIGVLGNGTLVLIFARHKNMRNVPNKYILSLALGDLLAIFTFIPMIFLTQDSSLFTIMCKISETGKDISLGVSAFMLTVLSADRYFSITDSARKLHSSIGNRRTTRSTLVFTGVAWTLAILFVLLRLFFRNFFKEIVKIQHLTFWRVEITAKLLMYYVIPLSVIGYFYILIAKYCIYDKRNVASKAQGQAGLIQAKKKVAKTVLIFVIMFAVCLFPQNIIWLMFYVYEVHCYNDFWFLFKVVSFVLSFLKSCVNPIVLYYVSGTFRNYFNLYLFQICREQKKTIWKQSQMFTWNAGQ